MLRGKGPEAVRAGRVPGECAVALRGVRVRMVRRTPEPCCGLPHRGGKPARWGRGLRFALALPPALLRPRRRGQGRVTGRAVCPRLGLGQLGGGAGLLTSRASVVLLACRLPRDNHLLAHALDLLCARQQVDDDGPAGRTHAGEQKTRERARGRARWSERGDRHVLATRQGTIRAWEGREELAARRSSECTKKYDFTVAGFVDVHFFFSST